MIETKQRPLLEGLFGPSPKGMALLATHCRSCGAFYFPQTYGCRNPMCDEKHIEQAFLSTQGKVYSYTIQRNQPPNFRSDTPGSYAIAVVELPEGIRVFGLLTGCEFDDIKIGMPVALAIEPLFTDDDGTEVLSYFFKPIK